MIVTFCGHRQIEHKESVHYWLERTIHELIQKGAGVFYLGGYGAFDQMAADIVHHAKLCHPQIESILVLPYLNRPIDLKYYDDTLYPPLEKVPGVEPQQLCDMLKAKQKKQSCSHSKGTEIEPYRTLNLTRK